jgi:hypothetical protein
MKWFLVLGLGIVVVMVVAVVVMVVAVVVVAEVVVAVVVVVVVGLVLVRTVPHQGAARLSEVVDVLSLLQGLVERVGRVFGAQGSRSVIAMEGTDIVCWGVRVEGSWERGGVGLVGGRAVMGHK